MTICRGKSLADAAADDDFAQVADADGASVINIDNDFGKVIDRPGQSDAAHGVLLRANFEELRAFRLVAALQRANHVANLDIIGEQCIRIEADLVLLFEAAKREHFGDARNGLQLILDDPVLDLAHFDEIPRPAGVIQSEVENDAQARRYGSHLWVTKPVRNVAARLSETFTDDLAGKIDVRPIFEIDVDHGQAEIRDRAHALEFREAGHGRLNRIGDIAFDLLRGEAFGFGKDLDQGGRHVRKGIHGQGPESEQAAKRHGECRDGCQEAAPGDTVHKIDHVCWS